MAYYHQEQSPPPYVASAYVVPSRPVSAFYVRDYLVWSVINIFCGWGLLGLIPLVCSIICRNNKNVNNYSAAQSWSTLALIANIIIITIVGAISWITFISVMVFIVAAASSLPFPTTYYPGG